MKIEKMRQKGGSTNRTAENAAKAICHPNHRDESLSGQGRDDFFSLPHAADFS